MADILFYVSYMIWSAICGYAVAKISEHYGWHLIGE